MPKIPAFFSRVGIFGILMITVYFENTTLYILRGCPKIPEKRLPLIDVFGEEIL